MHSENVTNISGREGESFQRDQYVPVYMYIVNVLSSDAAIIVTVDRHLASRLKSCL